MTLRRVLGCVLAIPLTCAVCVGLVWAYYFFITSFGRITDFKPLTAPGDTALRGTDYTLKVTEDGFFIDHFYLVNNATHQQIEILSGLARGAYTTFKHTGHRYVVVRSLGGGTNGAYNYGVADISSSVPRYVGRGQACSNPKLRGDHLEFYEVPGKCDFFPFGDPVSTWQMNLSPDMSQAAIRAMVGYPPHWTLQRLWLSNAHPVGRRKPWRNGL
jgi:hypothetical protein